MLELDMRTRKILVKKLLGRYRRSPQRDERVHCRPPPSRGALQMRGDDRIMVLFRFVWVYLPIVKCVLTSRKASARDLIGLLGSKKAVTSS